MTDSHLADELRRLVLSDRNHCFACGPGNDCGMRMQFREEGDTVRAEFTPDRRHSGWSGVVHGGIITTALDEAMAYVLYFMGIKGLTARLEVRFRRPAREGETLKVVARRIGEARRVVDVEATLSHEDAVIAEASGRFMKMGALTPQDLLASVGGSET